MITNSYYMLEDEVVKNTFSRNEILTTPGIWINGKTYWIQDSREKLIAEEGISVHIREEALHSKMKNLEVLVTNHNITTRKKVKLLFMHQHINALKDQFTFVSPTENVIFHLTNSCVYLVNAGSNDGVSQMTVHPYLSLYTESIWSCMEKGSLKFQPMTKGSSISILSVDMEVSPKTTSKGYSWVISGKKKEGLIRLNRAFLKNTLAFPFEK
ncbi:hypothetical protein SM124_04425 (plasmid) [Bacillus sp. 31A1R]|uniref:Uncharacterized protein n=1 Tax=Robertmurraya mangrovi TaxID=3098077 RepID=A0ABU5IV19_9BACI|nr:hypothetical protein [Bacillus sp. 31A1R]MDZ5470994.1 hypothetical protein [Bacillus sp. 31A1R]